MARPILCFSRLVKWQVSQDKLHKSGTIQFSARILCYIFTESSVVIVNLTMVTGKIKAKSGKCKDWKYKPVLPDAPVHRRPRLTRKASSEPWSAEPAGAAKPTSVPHARVTVRHYHLHGAQVRLRRLLRGAQQARSAPRTNVRALLAPASNEER